MVIKRFSNILGSKKSGTNPFRNFASGSGSGNGAESSRPMTGDDEDTGSTDDTPEANVARGVRLFCNSGGPNNQGEEVLHLPVIVEAAESSPQAATVAAKTIRKTLSKDNYGRPHVQYNAVMLIRILADNPGASFTRNLDGKFTATVKELLRTGKDPSVQQILRETLAALYVDKAYDINLNTLFQMWNKEQGGAMPPPQQAPRGQFNAAPAPANNFQQPRENYQRRGGTESGLPPPVELAARIEEAKTSAKLLQQLVQSTAPNELQGNDLVKEFADRCQTAQRSIQGYINCDDPPPDDETMQTLIETSEQLSLAASKHQRAVLQARRAVANASPSQDVYSPPAGRPPQGVNMASPVTGNTGYSSPTASASPTYAPSETQPLSAYSPPPSAMQTSYSPPPVPPPSMHANLGSDTIYSPPPIPPPSMRANLERRTAEPKPVPAPIAIGSQSQSQADQPFVPNAKGEVSPSYDNPFSDAHGHDEDEDDDPYHAPKPSNPAASSTVASVGTRPAPREETWRTTIPEEDSPQESYHPGFTNTPSYVKRQDSADQNLTMHGASPPPERPEAVSPVYESSTGDISPVFEPHTKRYSGGRGNGSATPGYRY